MANALKKPHLYAGSFVAFVVGWALATGAGAIIHGHPTYWLAYGLGVSVGCVAIVLSLVWAQRPRRTGWSIVATVALLLVGSVLWWLRPFAATEVALDALQSDELVTVDATASEVTMTPNGSKSGLGVIFLPGARVDARAYGSLLRPLAEAGHMVVIIKEPLGIAFFATAAAPRWADEHLDVATWVVAGHSLGGVVAAQNAADPNRINDLVLWASFPASDCSGSQLSAISVFGTNDGLTTPDRVRESGSDLPQGTMFVPIEGAVHSHFGDYGSQPGDGNPTTSRSEAQAEIISATLRFLDR